MLQPPIEPAQYTSADYANLARANGIVLSVGRKGECWDSAVAESFFATIKRELIDTRAWPTRTGLRAAVFDYLYRGLVQHPEASQLAWVPQPRRVRSHHPPQRRPPGGIINTTNLSVKACQLQRSARSPRVTGPSPISERSDKAKWIKSFGSKRS